MSNPRSSATAPTAGRPRDPQIDRAVLSATLEVLEETGYPGLSLDRIARRAGTSRPAIYRRYPGRAPLVLAAIATRLDVPAPPDSGCTLCDFGESFNVFLAAYRTIRPDALSSLYADCAGDPQLKARFLATIVEPPREAVREALRRAIDRDDLRPDVDCDQLLDMLGSLIHYRALFGREHLTEEEAGEAIEMLLRGVAVDYDELVAHSEALEAIHGAVGEGAAHHLPKSDG